MSGALTATASDRNGQHRTNDGASDFVSCGAGTDTAVVDSTDLIEGFSPTVEGDISLLTSCENVQLR